MSRDPRVESDEVEVWFITVGMKPEVYIPHDVWVGTEWITIREWDCDITIPKERIERLVIGDSVTVEHTYE